MLRMLSVMIQNIFVIIQNIDPANTIICGIFFYSNVKTYDIIERFTFDGNV